MRHAFFALIAAALVACAPQGKAEAATAEAYFAGGCFWCLEHDMEKIPGVVEAVSGYAGGELKNPTYERHAGHREAVKVVYDPGKINYRHLVDRFWRLVDPTDEGGQFCDRGFAYTTAVWVKTDDEKAAATASRASAAQALKQGQMTTPVLPFVSFWPAEGYHQDYADKNPLRYNLYRQGCGRDRQIKAVWGKKP